MDRPRRVLMVAYFFPPLGGAGVQRTLKFVKYLPQFGWRPTVVTTSDRHYPVADTSLLDEIASNVRVVRVAELRGVRTLVRYAQMGFSVLRLRSLQSLAAWPDEAVGWGLPALLRTVREIRRDRPDVLLTTSAPFTAHFVGLAASLLTGVPWVADFRDEWAANPHARDQPRAWRRVTRLAERAICAVAERVVVVADYFEIRGAAHADPVVITNGVDADDLPAGRDPDDTGVFRLSYVGTLYGEQDPAAVLSALRRMIDGRVIDESRFELRLVGNVWLRDFQARSPVPFTQTGYVEHERALAEMREATVLLLYVAGTSRAPSGKLYEYLAAERPVLCVARPDNLAYRLVEDWGAGRAAPPGDDAAIEAAILDLYRSWEAGTLAPAQDVRERTLERFGRRRLAGELAAVLDAAAKA